jgi:hypothetical protein
MLTYAAAQALIVLGVLARDRERVGSSEEAGTGA